ncbi:hypothetical protein Tco_1475811 [Tanacetum coccineum]
MSLANQKATTEYQEAILATEDLESPAVGFAKTSDYKGGLTNQVNAVIKQNNTLLYLATKQSQKLVELEEKFDKLKQEIHTIKEREVQPADLEDSISSLAKRLDSFSISGKLPKPTQEDQIRGYRQMARNRHQVARTTRRVFGRSNYNRTLETAVDPERQLEISRERRANLVPAEVLYSNNRRLQHIHLGIFMIRLHALHRRSAGTNALVVLRDTRWEDSRQIIATMEVDLSAGTQLVYTFPDMILSVNDFHNHAGYQIPVIWDSNIAWKILWITSPQLASQAIPGERKEYRQIPQPPRYSVDQHDREVLRNDNLDEDEEHFIGICLQTPQEEHISYDVCFCKNYLNEARILEEEPLNKVRRSNKPKRSKQRSWERWSTLGEPSGKWDYYVKYDAPPDTTPIEEIAATGWGDEFSDDEVTPGKVTILEERSDWDDDERSGGKVLVIQERLAQNQQEFLDEYLPQWDEHLAIQKQELESEWENPFAAKRGENHTILHLSKEEENDDLPYPKFRNFKQVAAQIIKKHEEHAFPSTSQEESTQSYQPPHDSIMGPSVYPPAQQNPQPFYRPDYQFGYPQGKGKTFSGGYGEYYNSQWTLPPAWTESGVMLVLPADPGLCEKLMWQQWRTVFLEAYSALEAIADEPQNITSQVRQLILLEDPYRGSTDEQDKAYRDLDRITCEETKICGPFLEISGHCIQSED